VDFLARSDRLRGVLPSRFVTRGSAVMPVAGMPVWRQLRNDVDQLPNPTCQLFLHSLHCETWQADKFTGVPVHDKHSHAADAFRGLGVIHKTPEPERPIEDWSFSMPHRSDGALLDGLSNSNCERAICGAKKRNGQPCNAPMVAQRRCRMHGAPAHKPKPLPSGGWPRWSARRCGRWRRR
jgi:hypothetical protein